MSIRVIIADEQFLIKEGIKNTLSAVEGVEVVGEASNFDQLCLLVEKVAVDVIILELNLCNGVIKDRLEALKIKMPHAKILVVSDCPIEFFIIITIRQYIAGFLRKTVTKEEFIKAIKAITAGQEYFTQVVTQGLLNWVAHHDEFTQKLSSREMQILSYIRKGRSNVEIGETLFISGKTVATHRKNIMKKVGVKKTSELILWALEKNI